MCGCHPPVAKPVGLLALMEIDVCTQVPRATRSTRMATPSWPVVRGMQHPVRVALREAMATRRMRPHRAQPRGMATLEPSHRLGTPGQSLQPLVRRPRSFICWLIFFFRTFGITYLTLFVHVSNRLDVWLRGGNVKTVIELSSQCRK